MEYGKEWENFQSLKKTLKKVQKSTTKKRLINNFFKKFGPGRFHLIAPYVSYFDFYLQFLSLGALTLQSISSPCIT